jgi:hypothetical protein
MEQTRNSSTVKKRTASGDGVSIFLMVAITQALLTDLHR